MKSRDFKKYIKVTKRHVRPYRETCGQSIFKFYKIQKNSENYETYGDITISYVEAMIKILEGLMPIITYDA
jgi:hypothetical protein